jgi:O-antigen ligase
MFVTHPLLGVGPDNYRLLYGNYVRLQKADPRVHSNNMYLEILAGTGALGLVCALWIAFRTARSCIRAVRLSPAGAGLAAACLAVAVHGLADSFLGFTATYIAIAAALGLAAAVGQRHTRHAHRV